jgi:hypothetical protein
MGAGTVRERARAQAIAVALSALPRAFVFE